MDLRLRKRSATRAYLVAEWEAVALYRCPAADLALPRAAHRCGSLSVRAHAVCSPPATPDRLHPPNPELRSVALPQRNALQPRRPLGGRKLEVMHVAKAREGDGYVTGHFG